MSSLAIIGPVAQGIGNYNLQRRQASILNANAKTAKELGAIEAQQIGDDRTRAIGAFVAEHGASGFAMDQSALSVIGNIAARYEFEAQSARWEAQTQSARLRNEAAGMKAQANLSLLKGVTDGVAAATDQAAKAASYSSGGSGG